MPLIDLETAVDHIRQACEYSNEDERTPFFFLVGAGISSPPIPLALEIISHCKTVAQQYNRINEPSGIKPLDIYSHWFHQAYPQPIQRQKYLRNLIEGKPISPANFRLAHLLLEKTITNLIVTTNFDDFLSRALTLFGKQHIVCDHPNTMERIDPEQNDIQIVHLHGTYWFYDCCNLRGEIEVRSQSSEHTTMTMSSLLDRVLSQRSPIVIGYGGWEGDVIMTALKRRLRSPLPYNLYWFCYRQTEVDSLPDWLRFHHQVYFVLHKQQITNRQQISEIKEGEINRNKQIKPSSLEKTKGFSENENIQTKLSAHRVLDKLIQTFELKAPELTSDPLNFFAKHLRRSLIENIEIYEKEADIYYINSVIEQIEQVNQKYTTIKEIESSFESVRDAMRRSQYSKAIKLASQIDIRNLTTSQLRELMNTTFSATLNNYDNQKETLAGYDLVITIGDILLGKNKNEPTLNERIAMALIKKGITLENFNRSDEAIAVYNEIIKRFGNTNELALREEVAKALVNKGYSLSMLLKSKDAINVYDEVVRRFDTATEPILCEHVAIALFRKANILGAYYRSEDSIKVYDEVVRRFGELKEPTLRYWVASAIYEKGVKFGELNHNDKEINAYEEVVKRYGDAIEPILRERVARSLCAKGYKLRMLNRANEAIVVYDEVVKRFGRAIEPELCYWVTCAQFNKAFAVHKRKKNI